MDLIDQIHAAYMRGMYRSLPDTYLPPDAVQLIVNGWVDEDGSVVRRDSLSLLGTAGVSGKPLGLARFRVTGGNEQWLAYVANQVIMSEAAWSGPTVIADDMQPDQFVSTTTMRQAGVNYLLSVNGGSLKRWDGTSWSTITAAPTGFRVIALFNDRIYGGGHDGNVIKASKIADMTIWATPDGLSLPIQTHTGDAAITGLLQIGNVLLVFQRNSTAYVDGYGYSDIIVAAGPRGVARTVGCVGFRTVIALGSEAAAWLSDRGLEYWRPGGTIELVSTPISEVVRDIAWHLFGVTGSGVPCAAYYPRRRIAYFCLPTVAEANDLIIAWRPAEPENQLPHSFALHWNTPATQNAPMTDANGYLVLDNTTDVTAPRWTIGDDGYMLIGADVGGLISVEDAEGYMALAAPNITAGASEGNAPAAVVLAALGTQQVSDALTLEPGTDASSYLNLDTPTAPELGWIETSDGYMQIDSPGGAPSDHDNAGYMVIGQFVTLSGGPERIISLNEKESGQPVLTVWQDDPGAVESSEVFLRLRTRPEVGRTPTRRKRARVGRFIAETLSNGTPLTAQATVIHRADDIAGASHAATILPGGRHQVKTRLGKRGYVHDQELITNGRVRVVADSIALEPLKEPA